MNGAARVPVRAELRVGRNTADPAVATARFHGGHCACDDCMKHDLDRHADALATLAGFVRRVFIEEAR